MKRYGLLGENVSASLSPLIHQAFSPESYELFSMKEEEALRFLREGDYTGLNVTMPYKKTVLPLLAGMTEQAAAIGCVNTVVRRPDGMLLGDNTDCVGLSWELDSFGLNLSGQKVLVLGSGGTSLTACYVLRQRGAEPVVISRKGENRYENLSRHREAFGLINTTPVGMAPESSLSPVDLTRFDRLSFVYDVVYTPLPTKLVQQAQELSIPCRGGLGMLVRQAAASRVFWGETDPGEQRICRLIQELEKNCKSNCGG